MSTHEFICPEHGRLVFGSNTVRIGWAQDGDRGRWTAVVDCPGGHPVEWIANLGPEGMRCLIQSGAKRAPVGAARGRVIRQGGPPVPPPITEADVAEFAGKVAAVDRVAALAWAAVDDVAGLTRQVTEWWLDAYLKASTAGAPRAVQARLLSRLADARRGGAA